MPTTSSPVMLANRSPAARTSPSHWVCSLGPRYSICSSRNVPSSRSRSRGDTATSGRGKVSTEASAVTSSEHVRLADAEGVHPRAEVVLVGQDARRRVRHDAIRHQLLVLVGRGAGPQLVLRGADDVVVVDPRPVGRRRTGGDSRGLTSPISVTGP